MKESHSENLYMQSFVLFFNRKFFNFWPKNTINDMSISEKRYPL